MSPAAAEGGTRAEKMTRVDKKISATDKSGRKSVPEVPEEKESVSLTSLFRYATASDLLLIFFGTVGAVGSGALRPVSSILFGEHRRRLLIHRGECVRLNACTVLGRCETGSYAC